MAIEIDMEALRARALEMGAHRAEAMSASKVIVDPRVRLKCSVPICENYGRNRMCPPNIISVEEFSEALARYGHVLVVQFEMDWGEEDVKRIYGGKDLAQLHGESGYKDVMIRNMRRMSDSLTRLEKEALYQGHRFAAALSGGRCGLCDECVGPGPKERCRHPFEARPSMEAVGIDVVATAKNAGLEIEFPAKGKAVLTGLLLVE
ncbi:MAG: DUF2284 domain-containing protein [Methanomassiliicoccales archaeon]|nr:DUF2284 domain-containing protein [Methanomassiliicoccales archaeon]